MNIKTIDLQPSSTEKIYSKELKLEDYKNIFTPSSKLRKQTG